MSNIKEVFNRLVALHGEISILQEDIKTIKEEFEESDTDVSFTDLNSLAKLKATNKLGSKVHKLNEFLELNDQLNGGDDE